MKTAASANVAYEFEITKKVESQSVGLVAVKCEVHVGHRFALHDRAADHL
jgi:hypothetical protein